MMDATVYGSQRELVSEQQWCYWIMMMMINCVRMLDFVWFKVYISNWHLGFILGGGSSGLIGAGNGKGAFLLALFIYRFCLSGDMSCAGMSHSVWKGKMGISNCALYAAGDGWSFLGISYSRVIEEA